MATDLKIPGKLTLKERLEYPLDAVYHERNQVVALAARMALAAGLRAGRAMHPPSVEWEADWRHMVFIQLPTGQASWHFHESEAFLLDGLPPWDETWDGHDATSKWKRVNAAFKLPGASKSGQS